MAMLETVRHTLGIAIRVEHHFLGIPIPDEMNVRVDTDVLPGVVKGRTTRLHSDGTYRFIDLEDGPHTVEIAARDDQWMVLEAVPVVVTPVGQPTVPLVVHAWPSPQHPVSLLPCCRRSSASSRRPIPALLSP